MSGRRGAISAIARQQKIANYSYGGLTIPSTDQIGVTDENKHWKE